MAKKRNPQDAYQIQIRSLKKRVAELETLTRRIRVLEDALNELERQLASAQRYGGPVPIVGGGDDH